MSEQLSFYEGQPCSLTILNQLSKEFGCDWIAIFPNGIKTTLSFENYKHYNFFIGQKIKGKIDKINCSGKIYFEPEHPVYKIGECYCFEVIEVVKKRLPNGSDENRVLVKDCYSKKIEFVGHKNYSGGVKYRFCVKDIHKGLPILVDPDDTVVDRHTILLTVTNIIFDSEIEYFELQNQQGDIFTIPTEWYKYHQIDVGNQVLCYYWYSATKKEYRIEPVHPLYNQGDIVEMHTVLKNNELFAVDAYGQEIRVQGVDANHTTISKIRCKVLRIRKGMPILKLEK